MKNASCCHSCDQPRLDCLGNKVDSICRHWYAEYSALFDLCSIFGWDFQKESKELLVSFSSTQDRHDVTTDELCEWVSANNRETLLGTIPVPDFTTIA